MSDIKVTIEDAQPINVSLGEAVNITQSGGGAWGEITGTLSDQTDLNTALNTKLESSDIEDFETTTELNTRDTNNRARTNHTGTQALSTISDAGTAASKNIHVGDTAPDSPSVGDLWVDTSE